MIAVPVELGQLWGSAASHPGLNSGCNDHLSNAIEVLTGNGECLVDAVDGAGMGENRREPFWMLPEQVQCIVGFVIGTADIVDCKLFTPHSGAVQ